MKKLYSFTKNGKDFELIKDENRPGWKYLLFGDYSVGYYKTPVSDIFKKAERLSKEVNF